MNYERDCILVSFFPNSQSLPECLRNLLIVSTNGLLSDIHEEFVQVERIIKLSKTFDKVVKFAVDFHPFLRGKLIVTFKSCLTRPP